MHYGGSTFVGMPERIRDAARLVNRMDNARRRLGELTTYQEAIRFWAYARVRHHLYQQKGDL